MLEEFGQWFWHDEFWLPPNVTWEQFKNTGNGSERYATSSDLLYPIPLALVLLLVRFLVENNVFRPIGRHLGIKEVKRRHPGSNEMLEKAFLKPNPKPLGHEEIVKMAKQLDMTERSIELWFRQRALFSKPSQLDKFAETGWRWTYYTSIFLWGLTSLWSKTWFWNIRDCWYKYPYHNVDSDIWWWYMLELGFYWGLLGTQFFDVKRKDFWMMFVHHGATIWLMSFSWTCNFFKVGTLVLIIHDVADIFLESAKLCKYGGAKKSFRNFVREFCLVLVHHSVGNFPNLDYLLGDRGSSSTDSIFPSLFRIQRAPLLATVTEHPMGILHSKGCLSSLHGSRLYCQGHSK